MMLAACCSLLELDSGWWLFVAFLNSVLDGLLWVSGCISRINVYHFPCQQKYLAAARYPKKASGIPEVFIVG